MHRLHLILFERRAVSNLKSDIKFPCEQEIKSRVLTQNCLTLEAMENVIVNAKVAANNETTRLGMRCEGQFDIRAWFKSVKGIVNNNFNPSSTQNNYLNINDQLEADVDTDFESDDEAEEHEREFSKIDNLDFLNADSVDAFLSLTNGQKMKKACFVWNQQNDRINISNDLRKRFISKKTITITSNENNSFPAWKSQILSKGDYILILSNGKKLFGLILNFKHLNKYSKSDSTFAHDHVSVDSNLDVGVLLDPVFEIINDHKIPTSGIHEYHPIKTYYICHCQPDIDFSDQNVKVLLRNL